MQHGSTGGACTAARYSYTPDEIAVDVFFVAVYEPLKGERSFPGCTKATLVHGISISSAGPCFSVAVSVMRTSYTDDRFVPYEAPHSPFSEQPVVSIGS